MHKTQNKWLVVEQNHQKGGLTIGFELQVVEERWSSASHFLT